MAYAGLSHLILEGWAFTNSRGVGAADGTVSEMCVVFWSVSTRGMMGRRLCIEVGVYSAGMIYSSFVEAEWAIETRL